jgi:hypothetical protein
MADDHLDKETSVSVALTEAGVTAKAKSRAIAAFDRLVGNVAERWNARLERGATIERAKAAGEERLIDAAVSIAIEQMKVDPELAKIAIEKHFESLFRRQENKGAVVIEALEDLKALPPPQGQGAESDPPQLSEEFLNRLERHAEEASTEVLRQKWARVLSSEIRKPGTFSLKALRLVDELDAGSALLFERVCEHRLAEVLPKCLAGDLRFHEVAELVGAGLLVDPGIAGQVRLPAPVADDAGREVWLFNFQDFAIGLPKDMSLNGLVVLTGHDKGPALPVYVLTTVGAAIATILPDRRPATIAALVEHLKRDLPVSQSVNKYRRRESGQGFDLEASIPGTRPADG